MNEEGFRNRIQKMKPIEAKKWENKRKPSKGLSNNTIAFIHSPTDQSEMVSFKNESIFSQLSNEGRLRIININHHLLYTLSPSI